MFDEAIVEMSTGTLVRLPELSARLAVGEKGPVCTRFVKNCSRVHQLSEYSTPSDVGNAEPHELLPWQC